MAHHQYIVPTVVYLGAAHADQPPLSTTDRPVAPKPAVNAASPRP